jgi:hypothetical protein
LLTIDVSPAHRRAFERMGLIATGHYLDKEAMAWAVQRFLDTAPTVQRIGDALYPDADDFMSEDGKRSDGVNAAIPQALLDKDALLLTHYSL